MVMSPTGGKVFLHLQLVPLQSVFVLGLKSELAQEVEMEVVVEEEEEAWSRKAQNTLMQMSLA
jgi:hypothetical protein